MQQSEESIQPESSKPTQEQSKDLGDRMKEYESSSRTYLDDSKPAIFRIDGHCFSKFTAGLKKPYDEWLHKVMVKVTAALVSEFKAVLGYTQSDEITLVLAPEMHNGKYKQYPFANQVQKLASLSAGLATNIFVNQLHQMISSGEIKLSEYNDHTQQKLKNAKAYFDSRVFNVPSLSEAYNNVYWRSVYDCIRNSVNAVAHVHFSQKEIQSLSSQQVKEKLKAEKNLDWESMDPEFKYGTFVKKKIVLKTLTPELQEKSGETEVQRRKLTAFTLQLPKYSPESENSLFEKILNEESSFSQKFLAKYLLDEEE